MALDEEVEAKVLKSQTARPPTGGLTGLINSLTEQYQWLPNDRTALLAKAEVTR
ncbi:MAG: hypothetical protein ACKVPX_02120 [Myxococcaceae bacterium]